MSNIKRPTGAAKGSGGRSRRGQSGPDQGQDQGQGTPIFSEGEPQKRPGPGTEAREIAKQQGQQPPTPQRDHEREREERRPASASSRKKESNDSGVKQQGGGVPSGSDEDVPTRPPGRHGESANIDEAEQPR